MCAITPVFILTEIRSICYAKDFLMPIRKTYKGKHVTNMRKMKSGDLLLTFVAKVKGTKRDRLRVTQKEWDTHGSEEFTDITPEAANHKAESRI